MEDFSFNIAEKYRFDYDNLMRYFLSLLLFIAYCLPVYGMEIDGRACLKNGRNDLESRKYEDAISNLSAAEREFPLLGDYALLWLSDAYHETGKHKESLKTIRILLDRYVNSSLRKKARIREIKEAEEVSEEDIQKIFESYIRDYPGDMEIRYLYAMWLRQNGKKDMAEAAFKNIYLDAGPMSEMAYAELSSSDISAEDMVKRASNLIGMMDFRGAESVLRSAAAKDNEGSKDKILRCLGLSLFKQKKYREAAAAYSKAGEKYWEIRSLYRAKEKELVDSALKELIKSGDKRAGPILVSVASDKRREGKAEEAVKMYQNVMEQYPEEREDALWGIGWTYFTNGEYKKAADVFGSLYESYDESKYLYWKARGIEADGQDALDIYHTIMEKGHDFYSVMSYLKVTKYAERLGSDRAKKFFATATRVKDIRSPGQKNDRVEALVDLGFSKEALSELVYISRNPGSVRDILYICSKFQELGGYKYSVRLAVKMSYMEELYPFRYPFAYQDIIGGLSEKYNIDPLLVLSVVREESRFDPEARSVAGALGLMQVMPQTAYRLDDKLNLDINGTREMLDVKNNLHFGIYLLSGLISEFGSYSYALAAYNAGAEIVRTWLRNGNYKSTDEFIEDIPYGETRNYVKKVVTTLFEYKRVSLAEKDLLEISIEKL